MRRQHLPNQRQAHGRAATRYQRRLQPDQGHVRLLAHPGHLRLRHRVEFGRRTAIAVPRRTATEPVIRYRRKSLSTKAVRTLKAAATWAMVRPDWARAPRARAGPGSKVS